MSALDKNARRSKLAPNFIQRLVDLRNFLSVPDCVPIAVCLLLLGIVAVAAGWNGVLPSKLPGDEAFNAQRVALLTMRSLVGWAQPQDTPPLPGIAGAGIGAMIVGVAVLLLGGVFRALRPWIDGALIRSARDARLIVCDDQAAGALVAERTRLTNVLLGDPAKAGIKRATLNAQLDARFLTHSLPRCAANTRALLALGLDSNANLSLARRLIDLRLEQNVSTPLEQLLIRIDSRELRSSIGRDDFTKLADSAMDAQLFSLPEARCRFLLRNQPPSKVRLVNRPGRAAVVIVGLGETGFELMVRLCAQAQSPYNDPLTIVLVDTEAASAVAELMDLWPTLAVAVALRAVTLEPRLPQSAGSLFHYLQTNSLIPTLIYLATEEAELAEAWEREIGLLVRLGSKESPLLLAVGHGSDTDRGLFADEERLDLLQRQLQIDYLNGRDSSDAGMQAAKWSRVSFDIQEDNRSVADHLWTKASDVDFRIRAGIGPRPALLPDEALDGLAAAEHRRWVASRAIAGWRFGLLHSESDRTHPSMVSWQELPDAEREKDRSLIREMPKALAAGGLFLEPLLTFSLARIGLSEDDATAIVAAAKKIAAEIDAMPQLVLAVEDVRGFLLAKRLAEFSEICVSLILSQPIFGLAVAAGLPPQAGSQLAKSAHLVWLTQADSIDQILVGWPLLRDIA